MEMLWRIYMQGMLGSPENTNYKHDFPRIKAIFVAYSREIFGEIFLKDTKNLLNSVSSM